MSEDTAAAVPAQSWNETARSAPRLPCPRREDDYPHKMNQRPTFRRLHATSGPGNPATKNRELAPKKSPSNPYSAGMTEPNDEVV